jgi:plasmid stability protein
MTKKLESTRSLIIRKIPDDVHRAFKSRCASEGRSQQDKIIELMREYAETPNPLTSGQPKKST